MSYTGEKCLCNVCVMHRWWNTPKEFRGQRPVMGRVVGECSCNRCTRYKKKIIGVGSGNGRKRYVADRLLDALDRKALATWNPAWGERPEMKKMEGEKNA